MGLCTIIWTIITAIIAGLGLYMILDRPNITVPFQTGWQIDHKLINTYVNKEYSSSTDIFVNKKLKTRDYYTLYGIRIKNEKSGILGRAEAKIHSAKATVWNSNYELVFNNYALRLWENCEQPEVYPLLPKDKTSVGKSIVVADGNTFDIVIAYNQENESRYYRWQLSSGAYDSIPAPRDIFNNPMPHFAVIEIQAHRRNKKFYLRIDEIERNKLNISVLEKGDFPKEIKL